jgi:hypothetical protein
MPLRVICAVNNNKKWNNKMDYRGRPEKEDEYKRDQQVTFRVTKNEKDLLDVLASSAKYPQRALFIYDLVTSLISQEAFTLQIPGEPAEELRMHYRNSATNLNILKRDFFSLIDRGINAESERKKLRAELKEHHTLTKQLHSTTFRKQLTLPITSDFWQQLETDRDTGKVNLLVTAEKLKNIRETKKGAVQREIAELELRLHELKATTYK